MYCKSKKVIKWGTRKTKNRGSIQRFCCRDCGRKFTLDSGFYRMRNSEKKITLCLDLFYRGISTRKIQEHLQAFHPENSSWVSIYSWIVKYSKMIYKFVDKLNVKTGEELMSDEMEYHRLGKQNWFVDVIDTKSRYIVSSEYMRSRTFFDMKSVMKKAKKKTGIQIKTVTTDGLNCYPRVLRNTFGLHKRPRATKITHNVVIASERGFNHKIERLHNSVRERTKTMRGFHGCIGSARAIMEGYVIFYNFIRKHQALGKTPSEIAIPHLNLGVNKWLDLIYISKKGKSLK
tara:strand:- start:1429 stop:2295 length:867 start_codon:yes stop_codon:yes gene_type:complete